MIKILLESSLILILILFLVQSIRLWRRDRQFQILTDTVERQEKMATLGHLLAGIAHELRTPLGAVSCSLDTARRAVGKIDEGLEQIEDTSLDQADRERLDKVKKALGIIRGNEPVVDQALLRTGQLVRQLRLAGRGDKEEPVPTDVNALVEGALVLLTHELKNDVTVDLQLGELPPVSGWPGPLGQVFLNLILNAQQAMEGPGRITVRTESRDKKVTVSVSDTGPGLPGHCFEQVFEPGWTTKPEDQGTGLGLFISRRIVERHGGRIEAGNGEAGGAVFVVSLPTSSEGITEAGA